MDPPAFRESRKITKLSQETLQNMKKSLEDSCNLNTAWLLAKPAPIKLFQLDINPFTHNCPSWSSFNVRNLVATEDNKRTVIRYCPMINAPSTDPSTIYTIPLQLKKTMEVLKQKHLVIAFDKAIYKIAKDIQWNKPTEFSNTII